MATSFPFIDAKTRVVRAINIGGKFVIATGEYEKDQMNVEKHAELRQMLSELTALRQKVEEDIQIIESTLGQNIALEEVKDNSSSGPLIDSFGSLYYELAAFSDVQNFPLISESGNASSQSIMNNQSNIQNNSSIYQLPKRKFPTFSSVLTEYQGFEDLFRSILSHVPKFSEVEWFEYLKTSLEGKALSLISHLPLTAVNYDTA